MASDKRSELVLTAARNSEEWALSALYRGLQPSLLGYLRAQRPADAEDVASETWIAVARGLRTFRGGEDDFRRWVFTIARRRLVDLARSDGRRPQTVSDTVAHTHGGPAASDAETEALASLATKEALALVSSLPPREAEVVLRASSRGSRPTTSPRSRVAAPSRCASSSIARSAASQPCSARRL